MEDNSNFDLGGFLNSPQAQANKPAAMQYLQSKGIIDPQGNPVPGKVKTVQPASPDTRNPIQKALGTFLDPIVTTAVRAGQAVGAGALRLAGIDTSKAMNQDVKVPFLGTNVPAPSKDTTKTVTGRALGTVALGVPSPATAGALLGASGALQDNKGAGGVALDTAIGAIGGKILEHGFNAVAPFVEQAAMKYGMPFVDKIAQYVPESAKGFMDNLASKLPNLGEKAILPKPISNVVNKGNEMLDTAINAPLDIASSKIYNAITGKGPVGDINAFITKNYTKAVRPSVAGMGSAPQVASYENKTINAVNSIVENKPNLQLLTDTGETVNKLPSTLKEFSQAIDQTKGQIFKQYDALASASGQAGAKVDLQPIVSELRQVSADPVIADTHPELAAYAESRAKAFETRGSYTPDETQRAIAIYNKSLEAFYKNPSYQSATKASIDSMIVNKMRSALDSTIENTSGAGYQGLKNQYGALKSIEKDVVHRAIVDGRKAPKGLLDFADIGSAAELMRGLVTMNPADFAASAGIKLVTRYYKYLNDPNTAVERLFSGAEKASLEKALQNRPSKATEPKAKVK